MRILSIDPGWSTGWAHMDFEDGSYHVLSQGTIEGGLDAFLKDSPLDWIIYHDNRILIEDFIPDGTVVGREATYSSLIIGAVIAICHEREQTEPTRQPRSDKASLYGENEVERFEFLRRNGFTGTIHELDAITHALVYAKRAGHEGVRRMILNG